MPSTSSSGAVHPSIRFARIVLTAAGTFGLIQVLPLYFAESALNRMAPPALTHPEFYYGFIGIVVAWQVAFLIMSRDPLRYRALFPALFLIAWARLGAYGRSSESRAGEFVGARLVR